MAEGAHGVVVGAHILGPLAADPLDLGETDRRLQGAGDMFGDAVLQVEDVVQRTVVFLGPDMRAALGFDTWGMTF